MLGQVVKCMSPLVSLLLRAWLLAAECEEGHHCLEGAMGLLQIPIDLCF